TKLCRDVADRLSKGHRWCWNGRRSRCATRVGVRRTTQMQSGKQLPAASQRTLDPLPTNAQVRIPPQPVGIDPTPFLLRDDLRPLRDQIEGGNRYNKTEPGEGVGITDERAFELKTIGFIVQEILFNIKASTVLPEGVYTGGLIPDNRPILAGAAVAGPP